MKPNDEETPEGYCDDCGLACYGVLHDDGIGPYEFWGQKGVDHQYVFRSNCCDAAILDVDPRCASCGKHEVYDFGLCLSCYEEHV